MRHGTNIHGLAYHCGVLPALRIIRKSSFTPKPWKNGGGVTHEVIRVPADGEDFEWRVSVARIEASGPFSNFAAYNRKMVLLEGDGVELKFGRGARSVLRQIGDLAEFDGALATHCTLLGGPCVDLNLMVEKSRAATAGVLYLGEAPESMSASASGAEVTLIFSIQAAIEVMASGVGSLLLEPWDLGVLSNGSAQIKRRESRACSNTSAVFLATITNVRESQCLPA